MSVELIRISDDIIIKEPNVLASVGDDIITGLYIYSGGIDYNTSRSDKIEYICIHGVVRKSTIMAANIINKCFDDKTIGDVAGSVIATFLKAGKSSFEPIQELTERLESLKGTEIIKKWTDENFISENISKCTE